MKRKILLAAACLVISGCASYYRVVDIGTGDKYYTTGVHRRSSGAVVFRDGRTGSEVTLQSTKITKITKEQYEHEDE